MTTSAITYREASPMLLAQAREELAAGDLRQASEKAWGAAAQIVKAAAQERRWPHNHHRDLWIAVDNLADDFDDQEIHDLFVFAGGLHHNFYENTYAANRVALNIVRVQMFIDKVDAIIDA